MTQVIPCAGAIFYNSQVWFASNLLPGLPNDDKVWAPTYRQWLLEQGAVLECVDRNVLRNSLGVAPGYDHLVFERDEDLTMFVLRWS